MNTRGIIKLWQLTYPLPQILNILRFEWNNFLKLPQRVVYWAAAGKSVVGLDPMFQLIHLPDVLGVAWALGSPDELICQALSSGLDGLGGSLPGAPAQMDQPDGLVHLAQEGHIHSLFSPNVCWIFLGATVNEGIYQDLQGFSPGPDGLKGMLDNAHSHELCHSCKHTSWSCWDAHSMMGNCAWHIVSCTVGQIFGILLHLNIILQSGAGGSCL
jgi:hypothetical protein